MSATLIASSLPARAVQNLTDVVVLEYQWYRDNPSFRSDFDFRPEQESMSICGCGNQGRVQLLALKEVLPIARAFVYSRRPEKAFVFAEEMSAELGIKVSAIKSDRDLRDALQQSDVCVTCTTARRFFIRKDAVSPGTFIAAVGADSPDKQELDPELLPGAKVVADILDQCAAVGELHHAISQGLMTRDDVHAELGEIVAGRKPGRTSPEEITIFDSTGTALQDVAAAAAIYNKAFSSDVGTLFNLT